MSESTEHCFLPVEETDDSCRLQCIEKQQPNDVCCIV